MFGSKSWHEWFVCFLITAHIDELEKAGSDGINKVDESKDDEELGLKKQKKQKISIFI